MDADSWEECWNPERMLAALPDHPDLLKLRLFAIASCRRVWDLLTTERLDRLRQVCEPLGLDLNWPPLDPNPCHAAVEAAERHANGLCDEEEWKGTANGCSLLWTEAAAYYEHHCDGSENYDRQTRVTCRAIKAAYCAGVAHAMHGGKTARCVADAMAYLHAAGRRPNLDAFDVEFAEQAELLRRIYGNPFRPAECLSLDGE